MGKVKLTPSIEPAESRIAVGRPRTVQEEGPRLAVSEMDAFNQEMKERAKYKIEIHFGKDRSSLAHKLCSGALLIWESGRRLHGGGDDKMYWCGWQDCGQPIRSELFGPFTVVCPHCQKECFLDPYTQADHIKQLETEGRDSTPMKELPCVVGERFFKMTPPRIADLLVKTFVELERNADIYLKFHPLDFRYDAKHESTADLDKLDKAREARGKPLIYPLRRIIADTVAGGDLRARFLAMITA